MAKITWDGRTLKAVPLNKAKLTHIMALQLESGLSMAQMQELGKKSELFGVASTIYLSQRTAGIFEPWNRIADLPLEELGGGFQIELEPGDRAQEAQEDADPLSGATPGSGGAGDPAITSG
jgi:hypothetical protein